MRVGSLFSGIGGFDLAAQWMGWSTAWVSEIDPFACAVLAKHFPDAPNHGDITAIDFTTVEHVDMLVGGFPCQDISNAGKREGITGERSGLWKEYARAIRELRPRYVVVENVAALKSRGLDVVLGDLAQLGYDAEWCVFGADDVGAPHRRDRLWILAYRPFQWADECSGCLDCGEAWCDRHGEHYADCMCIGPQSEYAADANREQVSRLFDGRSVARGESTAPAGEVDAVDASGREVADSEFAGLEGLAWDVALQEGREEQGGSTASRDVRARGYAEGWWVSEPRVGRVVNGVPRRVDQLRSLGNAIVPQCAYHIYQLIADREHRLMREDA